MSSPYLDKFSILSWNIDGRHEQDLEDRYKEVARIIEAKQFTIVFLQEVIQESLNYFKKTLQNYIVLGGQDRDEPVERENQERSASFNWKKCMYWSLMDSFSEFLWIK